MKKLLIATCMMLGFAAVASAQEKAKTPVTKPTTKMTAVKPATTTPPAKVVKMEKPATATTAKSPTKADGTPDMRFKANKNAPVKGPTKADGTPDMRYKANNPEAGKHKPEPKAKTKGN